MVHLPCLEVPGSTGAGLLGSHPNRLSFSSCRGTLTTAPTSAAFSAHSVLPVQLRSLSHSRLRRGWGRHVEPGFPCTRTSGVEIPGLRCPIMAPGPLGQQRPPGSPHLPSPEALSQAALALHPLTDALLGSCSRKLPFWLEPPKEPHSRPPQQGRPEGAPLLATAAGQGAAGGWA